MSVLKANTGGKIFPFVVLAVVSVLFAGWFGPVYGIDGDQDRIGVLVIPLLDHSKDRIDIESSGKLAALLNEAGFLNAYLPGIEPEEEYRLVPLYMWGELESGSKNGGMIWRLERILGGEFVIPSEAEYVVSGIAMENGGKKVLDVSLEDRRGEAEVKKIHVEADSNGGDDTLIVDAAAGVIRSLEPVYLVRRTESDLRRYRGGMLSFDEAVRLVRERLKKYPASLKLRTLLVATYLDKKDEYSSEIAEEAIEMIELYRSAGPEERRYLLYYDIDPFDIVASEYESRGHFEKAVSLREEALKEYPLGRESHRERIKRIKLMKRDEGGR